jgi:7-keto-8-aminopelargonate synthetase-like enzyme
MDSKLTGMIKDLMDDGRRRGILFLDTEDAQLRGRTITIRGRQVASFSSCSYLGLEFHRALIDGMTEAGERYGTQFSCSRGYLANPLYQEVEHLLSELFGGHVLLAPTTTLAHMAALPMLADERDALVLDHQVHHSVQVGANQARVSGTRVELVRHDHLDQACDTIAKLAKRHRRVWFCVDGVYSMYGDLAPARLLQEVLAISPNVRLYVDDAHGVSWMGKHGRGSFLDRFPLDQRAVLAASLSKGFGAGGACLVFSDRAELDLVRTSGGPLMFGGPMQPPMLGALRGSARVHLSPDIVELQEALRIGVDRVNKSLCEVGLVPIAVNQSPIFFLQCGLPRIVFEVAKRMLDDGVYVNCSVFPSVPMKRGGIRLSVTAAHTFVEIDHAIERLAVHIPAVLRDFGVTESQLAEAFAGAIPSEAAIEKPLDSNGLRMESATSIHQIDRATWDSALGKAAHCSWDALATAELVYGAKDAPPEHRWSFRYLIVRDHTNRVVAATYLTTLLTKDDMLAEEQVSREIETRRTADPYYLSSTVVMAGSTLSEGNHIYLDRRGPWRDALRLILAVAEEEAEQSGAGAIILRDLPDGDAEMDTFMLDEGFSRVPMLDTHTLTLDGADEPLWFSKLDKKKRLQLRPVLEHAKAAEVSFHGAGGLAPLTDEEALYLYRLFQQLAGSKLRINVFDPPTTLLPEMLRSPAWEFGVVRIRADAGGPEQPVGFWAAHKFGDTYAPFLMGIDPAYRDHDVYRVALLLMVRRTIALSMRKLRLGMDAEIEKRRFGARTERICMYVRTSDDYSGALLGEAVARAATDHRIGNAAVQTS